MSSWSQWFVSYQKNQAIKQITWLCGTEPVLIEDIVDTIKGHFSPEPWCHSLHVVGDDSERLVWADLDQYPIDGRTPRLIVVRGAERLKHPERIIEWLKTKNKNPLTHVIFVSAEASLAREERPPGQRDKTKPDLVPHLKAIQGKGALIECKPFTQATAKHAVTWVQSKVEIRRGVAGKLLERANGDLRLTRDAFRKLSEFPDEITEQTIELLLSAQPRMTFVNAMLEIDKRTALLALEDMQPKEFSAAIGLLDHRLDIVGVVRDMLVSQASATQIAVELGTMGFLAKDLIPLAKSYDAKRRRQLRNLLARTDAALRDGIVRGPMEILVAYW